MISKKDYNKNVLIKYASYFLLIICVVVTLLLILGKSNLQDFFLIIEKKSFDAREQYISQNKKVNPNIIIVNVDDNSLEYLQSTYGEWPIPRGIYANIVDFLEQYKPNSIAFDLMFINSLKVKPQDAQSLSNVFKKYSNVYSAINFDNQTEEIRKAPVLDKKFQIGITDNSNSLLLNKKNGYINFKNCRLISDDILKVTKNIGHINLVRDNDGISRTLMPFIHYTKDNSYYPHLALLVGINYLNEIEKSNISTKKIIIDKKGNLLIGKRKIPLDGTSSTILNWYDSSDNRGETFKYIPIWKILKLMDKQKVNNQQISKDELLKTFGTDFENSIIYIGTTAASLYDIKSVPINQNTPGVELHTTFINNLIDNSFIKRATPLVDIIITLFCSLIIGFIVLKTESTIITSLTSIFVVILYIITTTEIMNIFNYWISLTLPIAFMLLTFTMIYVLKYIFKSKDFEHTYKLATTDGLTELYNHRFFQEQMILSIETAKRYNTDFSLVLIDIDFFKKFNDTFGHQSGDAVLKQVAQILKKNVRSVDIVCRYGGEEMAIILPNTNNIEAFTAAQKICNAVAATPFQLAGGQKQNVTISLGIATYPQDGENSQEIIAQSDKGLYKAKENGRNQVGKL